VEANRERIVPGDDRYILGNAADLTTLTKAGIQKAPAVVITPNDDDTTIYLTIFCRRLRPDIQILSRATR
jgi:Trk K+ transport system NAD-binding subunit